MGRQQHRQVLRSRLFGHQVERALAQPVERARERLLEPPGDGVHEPVGLGGARPLPELRVPHQGDALGAGLLDRVRPRPRDRVQFLILDRGPGRDRRREQQGELEGQVGILAREVERDGLVVHDDRVRKVALGVPTAGLRSLERAEQAGRDGAQRDGSLQSVPEVLRAHGFAGRVHDPLAERESIAQAVGGDLGERRRQVRDERGPIRTAHLLVGHEGVVGDRLDLPDDRVVPDGRVERERRLARRGHGQGSASVFGGRGTDGQPEPSVAARERGGRSAGRDRALALVRVRVDHADHVVELVRHPQRAAGSRERVRALVDGDGGLFPPGRGVEPRHGAIELVRDPDRSERGDDRGRPVPHLLREHDVRTGWVDARDAVRRDRDPHGFRRERDARGQAGEREGGDLLGVGIHAEERTTDRVDDPQHAVAERDPRRCGAGTDRLADLVGLDVDPADGAVPSVGHPDRPLADRDARGRGADPDRGIGDRARLEIQARHDASVRLRHPEAPEPDRTGAGPLAELGGVSRERRPPRSGARSSSSRRRPPWRPHPKGAAGWRPRRVARTTTIDADRRPPA